MFILQIVFGLLFLLAAGVAGFVALVVIAGYHRLPRRSGLVSIGCLAAAALLLGFVPSTAEPPDYRPQELRRVQAVHAGFAPRLEAYREKHGQYPPTLAAAGISTPKTLYGPLDYTAYVDQDGKPAYTIAFGDYFKNGFQTYWSTTRPPGDWYMDT